MPYSEKKLEKLERQIPRNAAKAVKQAYSRAIRAGLSVLIVQDGILYRVSPDGTRATVKKLPSRVAVQKGSKLRIR